MLLSTKPAQRGTTRLADRADDSERPQMDSMAERLRRSTCHEDRLGDWAVRTSCRSKSTIDRRSVSAFASIRSISAYLIDPKKR